METLPLMLSRRRVLAAAVTTSAVASIPVLAACGVSQEAGSAGKAGKPITGTLSYWPEGGQTNASYQAWVARIADFQKAYPEAKVEMTEIPDHDAKLITA